MECSIWKRFLQVRRSHRPELIVKLDSMAFGIGRQNDDARGKTIYPSTQPTKRELVVRDIVEAHCPVHTAPPPPLAIQRIKLPMSFLDLTAQERGEVLRKISRLRLQCRPGPTWW